MEDTNQGAVQAIRKEVTAEGLLVSRVYSSEWQKEGTLTAELKQSIITKSFYPSKSVSNNMQDNIFGQSDFGFEEQEFENKETRVAWIDVPNGSTVETIIAKLIQFTNAKLYRVLSNVPILTNNQVYAVDQGLTTKEKFANSQVVRYPEGAMQGNVDVSGKLALDNYGKPQYRAIFFSNDGTKSDKDLRTSDEHFYASEEIVREMQGVHVESDQTL